MWVSEKKLTDFKFTCTSKREEEIPYIQFDRSFPQKEHEFGVY